MVFSTSIQPSFFKPSYVLINCQSKIESVSLMYDSLSTIAEGVQKFARMPSIIHGSAKVKDHYETGSNLLALSSLVIDWTKFIQALKSVQKVEIAFFRKCTRVALEALGFLYSFSQALIFLNDKQVFSLSRSLPIWNGICWSSSLAIDSCDAGIALRAACNSQLEKDKRYQKRNDEMHWVHVAFVKSVFSIFATLTGAGVAICGGASSFYLGIFKKISLICSGVYYLLKNYLFYFRPVS